MRMATVCSSTLSCGVQHDLLLHLRGGVQGIVRGREGRHDLIAHGLDDRAVFWSVAAAHHLDADSHHVARAQVAKQFIQLGAADDVGKYDGEFDFLSHVPRRLYLTGLPALRRFRRPSPVSGWIAPKTAFPAPRPAAPRRRTRNRRQARAPSRPAIRPCMCRVIECRRMPRCELGTRIGHDALDDLPRLRNAPGGIDQRPLEFGQQRRPVIGGAAEHDAVQTRREVRARRRSASRHAAVQYHGQLAAARASADARNRT